MKKNNKKTEIKNEIKLPAHLQMIADRFNSNYKNAASEYVSKFEYKISDVTPKGYEPAE